MGVPPVSTLALPLERKATSASWGPTPSPMDRCEGTESQRQPSRPSAAVKVGPVPPGVRASHGRWTWEQPGRGDGDGGQKKSCVHIC